MNLVLLGLAERLEENAQAQKTMWLNLADNGLTEPRIPIVLQYNKQDLENAAAVAHLDFVLNPGPKRLPRFTAAAAQGYQVFETLNARGIEVD